MSFDYSAFRPDKESRTPLHCQIRQFIYDNIKNGNIRPDECIPPELELTRLFGVSRSTVRQALNKLVTRDVLVRCKGKGTFVKPEKIEATFFQTLTTYNEEMTQKGIVPSTRVLVLKTIPPVPAINTALELDKDEPLIYLERVRSTNGQPNVYMESYLPFRRFAGLEKLEMGSRSLYTTMEEAFGVRVNRVVRHIEVTTAQKDVADLLSVPIGAALFYVTFTGYAGEGIPVEYSISRYRGDTNKFVIELSR